MVSPPVPSMEVCGAILMRVGENRSNIRSRASVARPALASALARCNASPRSARLGTDVSDGGHHRDQDEQEEGQGRQAGHGLVAPAPATQSFHGAHPPSVNGPVFEEAAKVFSHCRRRWVTLASFMADGFEDDGLKVTRDSQAWRCSAAGGGPGVMRLINRLWSVSS